MMSQIYPKIMQQYLENRACYEHSSVLCVLGLTFKDPECSGLKPNLHRISAFNSAF